MTFRIKNCVPCKKGEPPISAPAEEKLLREVPSWNLDRSGIHRLFKEFTFSTFVEAVGFANSVAIAANDEEHHPTITIEYRKVVVTLTTPAVQGLSENDFIMAAKIDDLYSVVRLPAYGVYESAML
ncbi:MAG: 4a-hydroxytetrahydrobiopterin dehydratase [Chitinispirillaceae bacterium]|nr:4a-hydroxytetrahydrobiopterin dehydratase [Chitinispirillaceae bacterium]